ncbi:MAG: stage II sporulation protein M [Caulobacteraceae bacterium]|nr:stage II sporulation protein M [Caulobacteraceae bacterium]
MKPLELRSHRFRAEREGDWRRLESLLTRAEAGRIGGFTDAELLELPLLYRSAVSSLSVARAIALEAALLAYLEALVARAYFFVYGARGRVRDRVKRFFLNDWPAAVKALWRETALATAIFVIAVGVGYALVTSDSDWYGSILPAQLAHGRDPAASTETLRAAIYGGDDSQFLTAFATFLFTHNAQVSLLAFALGFAFGVPAAAMMGANGLTLGALLALYASRGLGFQLGGWLAIHGATELFATILAGAAGMRIGWAVAFPGERTRLEAAATAGRTAGTVMAGVLVMLAFAGVLEGVARQLIKADLVRWGIGAFSLTLWLAYFYLPSERRR